MGEDRLDLVERASIREQVAEEFRATTQLTPEAGRYLAELVGSGAIAIEELAVAVEEVEEDLLVVGDEVEDVAAQPPGDLPGDFLILPATAGIDADPAVQGR